MNRLTQGFTRLMRKDIQVPSWMEPMFVPIPTSLLTADVAGLERLRRQHRNGTVIYGIGTILFLCLALMRFADTLHLDAETIFYSLGSILLMAFSLHSQTTQNIVEIAILLKKNKTSEQQEAKG